MSDKRESLLYCINIYRSLPALWNTNDPQYTNRQAKNRAYDILLASYKTYDPEANRETLVKKINSLRTNFRKELKKVENSKRTAEASGSNEIYVPTLWYYKDLMFLVDQETPEELNGPRSSVNGEILAKVEKKGDDVILDQEEAQPKFLAYAQATVALTHNSPEAEMRIATPPAEAEAHTQCHTPPKRKKRNEDKSVDYMFKLASHHLNKDDDEFLILAKSYAQKLKNMLPLQRLFADRLIHEVLLEGQLGNLSRHSSVELNSAVTPLTVQTHLCRSDLHVSRPSSSISSLSSEDTTYSGHSKCSFTKLQEISSQILPAKENENSKKCGLKS